MNHPEKEHLYKFLNYVLSIFQTIIIMGAHTLGRMNTENSGHSGPWLPGNEKQTFSNKYYSSMLDNNNIYTGRVS